MTSSPCHYCSHPARWYCEGCSRLLCEEHATIEEYRPLCLRCSGQSETKPEQEHQPDEQYR